MKTPLAFHCGRYGCLDPGCQRSGETNPQRKPQRCAPAFANVGMALNPSIYFDGIEIPASQCWNLQVNALPSGKHIVQREEPPRSGGSVEPTGITSMLGQNAVVTAVTVSRQITFPLVSEEQAPPPIAGTNPSFFLGRRSGAGKLAGKSVDAFLAGPQVLKAEMYDATHQDLFTAHVLRPDTVTLMMMRDESGTAGRISELVMLLATCFNRTRPSPGSEWAEASFNQSFSRCRLRPRRRRFSSLSKSETKDGSGDSTYRDH